MIQSPRFRRLAQTAVASELLTLAKDALGQVGTLPLTR
jgi:hypothetical protein